jgi:hypothetical protein
VNGFGGKMVMATRTDKLDLLCNLIAMVGCVVVMFGLINDNYAFITFVFGGAAIGLGLAMKFDIWKLHPKHAFDEGEKSV